MKSALRMCACWPSASPVDDTLPVKLYRILVNVCVTFVCLGGALEILAFWGQVDMNETIECSLVVSALSMATIRLIVFNRNAREMFQVLDTMRQDWTVNYTSAEDRAVLRNRCRLSFKLAKIFISSVVITWALFSAMPYVEALHGHRRILPFRGYYFFDLDTASSPVYLGVYVMNFTLGAFGCSTIAAATSFSLIATIHASAKFAIVKKKFETIDWNEPEQVKMCVQDHQNCIKYAENVETVINILALGQFVVSTGLICFAGFQVTTMMKDHGRLMKYSSFLQAAIMELFIFSLSGQLMQTESLEIAEHAYNSQWIGCTKSINIRMVITRSRKACTITAGKFYDMSLESFLKVLSSSFSYFTVLITVKDG
ncbi:odorant receptor 13a-like [Trichogramma pretiosum]|uniref:odorant receptor 13a-like n=1 Tax=Trichogramma pretiosum TaxID=7493 RepID=UPI000C71C9BF|nr:odorant receptor 13a-like [Trichogramma pretiosum]